MAEKFTNNILVNKPERNISKTSALKLVNFLSIPPLSIPPKPTKEQLSKSKFHGKNRSRTQSQVGNKVKLTYAQVLFTNIKEILKNKDNFSNLSIENIEEINKIINDPKITKLCFNMTTKGLSHKQIICNDQCLMSLRWFSHRQ